MEPNLSASISTHSNPFNLQRTRSTSQSATPGQSMHHNHPQHPPHSPPTHHHHYIEPRLSNPNGASTAVEPLSDDGEHTISRHSSTVTGTDIESQSARRHSGHDPYNLQSAYKTDAQLDEIKANTSRKRDAGSPSQQKPLGGWLPVGRKAYHAHKVQTFYKSQNETIQRLLKSVEEHRAEAVQSQGDEHLRYQIAVYGSFAANVILSILQIYGAVSSGSLSLFTTMADAIFDPMSNLTLILTNRAVKRVDPNRFPSGKARLETVGNITFCFLMTAVSLILIAFSAKELADTSNHGVNKFHLPSVIAVVIAFSTKLSLFLYCWGLKNKYSQINILWQDHRNDLLINGFGILTSVGGAKLIWWIDPMGAIIISLLISCIWLRTAFTEFLLLVGVVASVETQQLITYVCLTHSSAILGIDTVRVYHSGPRLIAEVDVVMDPNSSLRATHDVAEELQFKLEDLPDVERAYVHVDYETTHKPEHALKKEL